MGLVKGEKALDIYIQAPHFDPPRWALQPDLSVHTKLESCVKTVFKSI